MPPSTERSPHPSLDPEQWLAENVGGVTRIVAHAGHRHHLPVQDRQELLSVVWTHLARDNYRVLRQFRGRSGVHAYIRVVVDRLILDQRTTQWGRWRPSARARRLGPEAVLLERLVVRDGQRLEVARDQLQRAGRPVPRDFEPLLPNGVQARRFVALDEAVRRTGPHDDPFAALVDRYRAGQAERLAQHLSRALAGLSAQDQQLLQLRHDQGLQVTEIAARLGVDRKQLYRRLDRIHARLRRALTLAGVEPTEAVDVTTGQVSHLPRVLASYSRDEADVLAAERVA